MKKSQSLLAGNPAKKIIFGLKPGYPLLTHGIIVAAAAVLSFFLLYVYCSLNLNTSISAEKGHVIFPDGKKESDGLYALTGDWYFSWNEFLENPNDFPQGKFITVPSSWTESGHPASGCASYGIDIDFVGTRPKTVSIYIGFITSSYRLLANGKEITAVGKPDTNLKAALFQWYPTVKRISVPDTGSLNLIFQVANAEHSRPGIRDPILIDLPEILEPRISFLSAISLFLWGILLFITTTYAFIAFFRPFETHFLYFAAIAVSFLLNRFFAGTVYLNGFFPGLPWSFLVRLEYLSYPLISCSLFGFIRTLHPAHYNSSRALKLIFCIFILALALFTLAAPLSAVTSLLIVYQASLVPALFLAGVLVFQETKHERNIIPAILAVVYSTLALGALISDTLAYHGSTTPGLASFLVIVLFISHAVRIGINHSKARMMAEDGTRKLSQANDDLLKLNLSLAHSAHQDLVTGLPNRLAMHDFLNGELNRAARGDEVVAVLFIDLDNFKSVNDNLGHQAGDELLALVGKRLLRLLRSSDRLFRIGGDEFVVVCPDIANRKSVTFIGDRISRALCQTFGIQDREVLIGSSTGIALFPEHGKSAEELLRCADIAMYRVKEFNKGSFALYEKDPADHSAMHMDIGGRLPKALEMGNIHLEFQPQTNPTTGEILCLETLARWTESTGERILPVDFIRTAEETGFIHILGDWILQEACREARLFTPGMRIAVNLSPMEISGARIVKSIETATAASGFDPKNLVIEITETAFLHNPGTAISNLKAISALGSKIALDDFGTGYSSLMNLKNLPIDQVKIDRSFITGIQKSCRDQEIVKAVITMAHGLGIEVCAEGVEEQEQQKILREFKVDMIQGYLTGRSMPGTAFHIDGVSPQK